MKRLLLLMAVMLTAALSVQAQRTISGKVIDSEEQEAVIQATVALLKSDSSLVTNAVTNVNGVFSMTAPRDGRYIVRVTYIGFKPVFRDVTVSGQPLALGTLTMEPDSKMLKGIEVVKNQAKVYSKGDTLVYNADAYRTPEGSVVEELVKRMPGAEVDDEGNIKINGKSVSKIKVDGKEFGDAKTALKNLPTSVVERIKSYEEKSDLARITGIDDGNEQTVLDFGLRRGMNRGMFANADLAAGTKDRYSGRIFAMFMKDDFRLMAMLNGNNTNDQGFGGGGGRRFGGRGGNNGLNTLKSSMLNFNYEKTGKFIGQAFVMWNHRNGDVWSRSSSENFVSTTNGSFSNSLSQNYSRANSWSVNGRLEWTPDTAWNISFRPSWSYSTNDGRGWRSSATFNSDPYAATGYSDALLDGTRMALLTALGADSAIIINRNKSNSLSYGSTKSMNGTLQINRKLSNTGRNVTLQMTGQYSDSDSKSLSSNLVDLFLATMPFYVNGDTVNVSDYQTNRYNVTPTTSYSYSARATYSEPIARATFLQFSYTFQYRYNESDRSTWDFSNPPYTYDMNGIRPRYREWRDYLNIIGNDYNPTVNDGKYDKDQSRYSAYKNYIHTGEVMLRFIRNTYDFNVGVQVIPQTSEYTQRYLGVDTVVNRSVINWSPTANFRWRFSDRGEMRFEYRGNTSQPSISQLLEIKDNTDPLNINTGNASLKPSFTQSFNLRYNNYFERHQRFIFANASFSTTSNSIVNKVTYDQTTGGRKSQPVNIKGNWNANGRVAFNTSLDTLGYYSVNTETSLSYSHQVSYLDLNRTPTKNYTNTTNVGERIGFSYRNSWLELEPNGSVNYTYSRNHLQSKSNLDTWTFSYGMNATVTLPWGTQLSTDIGMNSRRGFNDASMNTNELIWNAQIAQGFLTGKPLTVTLQFFDILHQQSNFTRTINALSRTDNEYNAINSYAMLHVIYRLNIFGTREARQGMRMGGGFGGGFGGGNRGGNRGGTRGGGFGGGFGGPGRF